MRLLTRHPGRPKKHRADDRIALLVADYENRLDLLRRENAALLNAKGEADDGALIQEQLITDLTADVERLTERAAITQKHLAQQAGITRALRQELGDQVQRRVDRRNVETAATKTQPIRVLPLHQAPPAA